MVAEMRHRTGVWRVCTVGKCRTEIPCKTGDFDEYRDVRVEHFTYNGKDCSVDLYSLETIIALGFRMKGLKCEAFRKWAARRLAESFEKKKSTVILCMSGEKRNSWN